MKILEKIVYKVIKGIVHFVSIILFRIEKNGEENIKDGVPYILCANHKSNWDPLVIGSCTKRKVCFMAKAELFKNPFFKMLANTFGIISVKRGAHDLESIKKSLKALKENEIIGIFPEGTRNGLAKNIKVKTGATFLALRAGVKIIPVGIEGDYKIFHKVKINYGKPLDYSEYYSKNPEKETLEKLTEEIMNSIIMLTNKEK